MLLGLVVWLGAAPDVLLIQGAPLITAKLERPELPSTGAADRFRLALGDRWLLEPPKGIRFDASALLRLPDGTLLTLNDRAPVVHRIVFRDRPGVADLVAAPDLFSTNGLAAADGKRPLHFDSEGLGRDDSGRIYLCEESRRQIYRFDPASKRCEALPIDWARVRRYFDATDANASFEGLAIGGRTLYVANERKVGRIITVDLESCQVTGHFQVTPADRPAPDVHYTDLSWFENELWVLCRESRCVLRVDPTTHRVRAEFDYSEVELAPENAYYNPYPGYGFVEGLAVDRTNIWLAVDNNNFPRIADRNDRRPSLFRCPRPDLRVSTAPR